MNCGLATSPDETHLYRSLLPHSSFAKKYNTSSPCSSIDSNGNRYIDPTPMTLQLYKVQNSAAKLRHVPDDVAYRMQQR